MLVANCTYADIPFMPFSIKIAQAYPVIEEGDPIMLNVTLKNNDPKRRLPVLIPGAQNAFEKIYYFKIYDAADNYWQLRWVESRQVQMTRMDSTRPTLKYLAPGEQVVFSANLNDYPRYYQQIESHHAVASPILAGQYKVFLIYDPTGNPIGDTLYKYYDLLPADDCDDAGRKLCFPSFGQPSEPFQLNIRKSDRGSFTFQSVVYETKRRANTASLYDYFRDGRLIRVIDVPLNSSLARQEIEMDESGKQASRSFVWFASHNIKAFTDRGWAPCNGTRTMLKMRTETVPEYAYRYEDNATFTYISYNSDGLADYSFRYTIGETAVIWTAYKVQNGLAKPGKVQQIKLASPFFPCGFAPSI